MEKVATTNAQVMKAEVVIFILGDMERFLCL